MERSRNLALIRWMGENGVTARELAEQVNAAVHRLTGRPGLVTERTVLKWRSGATRWPQNLQRAALRAVTGLDDGGLGFTPPRRRAARTQEEPPVHRRTFITATTGTALATTAPAAAGTQRVGHSDIDRLQARFADLIASDHKHGGRRSIEQTATALADEALALQQRGTASQRVRARLYGCAAAFTSSALWAAIDGKRFEAAQQLLDQASRLAAMSGDHATQFRIWSHAGSLYRHQHRPADALAANDVARNLPITRRDPMFASLGHARHAAILGLTGNTGAVERALAHAREAHTRADPREARPVWMTAFYGPNEIHGLALPAHLSLGNYAKAEAHAHRCLSLLPAHMQRSRILTTVRMARAQLGQQEHELAVATAMSIPATSTRHPRIAAILADFTTDLHAGAPGSDPDSIWRQYLHDTRKEAHRA